MEGALAIIGIFFLPIIMIILIVYFITSAMRKRNKYQAELYTKALEKGQEIPANLFNMPVKYNYLNIGIICIAAGVGLALFLWLAVDPEFRMRAASIGVVPICIGIGYFLIHLIRKDKKENESAE